MTTKKGTKTSIRRQRTEQQKLENIYSEVKKYAKDEKVADKLIEKYGVNCAYAIVRQCMQDPADTVHRMVPHARWLNTGEAMKFFVGAKLNDEAVARGIHKTVDFVKKSKEGKNTTAQAKTSQNKVTAKTQQRTVAKTKSNVSAPTQITAQTAPQNSTLTSNSSELSVPTSLNIDQQVDFELKRLKKENPNGVTLGTLKEDGFVIDSRHIASSDLKHLTAGRDGKGLSKAVAAEMASVSGSCQCARPVREGYTDYMNKTYNMKISSKEREFYGRFCQGSNAAANLYQAFENEYFSVFTYKPEKGGIADLNNVPDGTTVFFEAHRDTAYEKKYNAWRHPGHTATYNAANGTWSQGGRAQSKSSISGAHYAAYGKTYKVAIANDTTVDDVLLRKMIRQRIEENERNQSRTIQQQRQSGGR